MSIISKWTHGAKCEFIYDLIIKKNSGEFYFAVHHVSVIFCNMNKNEWD